MAARGVRLGLRFVLRCSLDTLKPAGVWFAVVQAKAGRRYRPLAMERTLISTRDTASRAFWIDRIRRLSGDFGSDAERVEQTLADEVDREGLRALVGHLRLCGVIPEGYGHDSSAEKLYAKYTDIVIHEAFKAIGLASIVLGKRTDAADVECVCDTYDFVADAKAFRLSRTAKNQKDFKVQALDDWKHGKRYAMVVCPVYQLPFRTSQIYQQAASRSVCICTYTHLSCLVRFADVSGQDAAIDLLRCMFVSIEAMLPSKNANEYWQIVNGVVLSRDGMSAIWREEKIALLESVEIARREALGFLAEERERIMKLSRQEAIREVLNGRKLDARIRAVESVAANRILDAGDSA